VRFAENRFAVCWKTLRKNAPLRCIGECSEAKKAFSLQRVSELS
jgi:hypothetical protein